MTLQRPWLFWRCVGVMLLACGQSAVGTAQRPVGPRIETASFGVRRTPAVTLALRPVQSLRNAPSAVPIDTAAEKPFRRSAMLAFALGAVMPGAGHWCADEWWRGWAILGINVVSGNMIMKSTGPTSLVFAGIFAGNWIHSMVDAPFAAKRFNTKHALNTP